MVVAPFVAEDLLSAPPADIGINEEMVSLYAHLGLVISQWAYVEWALCNTFHAVCSDECRQDVGPGLASIASFYAVQSFRAKVGMTDAAVWARFQGTEKHELWVNLRNCAFKRSDRRNELAHFMHHTDLSKNPGKRHILRAPIFAPQNNSISPLRATATYDISDLIGIRFKFFELSRRLDNYTAFLEDKPEPYPAFPLRSQGQPQKAAPPNQKPTKQQRPPKPSRV